MPIYEYTCPTCEKTFDHLQRNMQSSAAPPCPTCGSTKTTRALSVFAVASDSASTRGGGGDDAPSCDRCGGAPGSCMS